MPENSRFVTSGGRMLRREADGGELWIEPTDDKTGVDADLFWFMWYGPGRQQRIKHSAVFTKQDFTKAAAYLMGVPDA